jgi:alanine racemase
VNVAAIERNCTRLRAELRPTVALCAVVKADGYGHGAAQSARAALHGGASWLAVAAAREARELRDAGLQDAGMGDTGLHETGLRDAGAHDGDLRSARTRVGDLRDARILVMGALTPPELREALAADADVVVWRERDVEAVAAAGGGRVHVKLDSGMGRLGTRDLAEASRVVAAARFTAGVELAGVMTHFATADDLNDDGFFLAQLAVFADWARVIKVDHPEILVHAANSAAVLRDARAHFDMVRCGIALYGMDPFGEDPTARGLEPALELSSYVAEVKRCGAGESAGYGRRFVAAHDTHLGVLPIGYGDGWRRGLSNNADLLVDGQRRPLVGTVSMDNITVDLGPDPTAQERIGAPAILIGAQGSERITAEEVARRLDTIDYEVTCALTPRVPRVYHRDGEPLEGDRVTAHAPPDANDMQSRTESQAT